MDKKREIIWTFILLCSIILMITEWVLRSHLNNHSSSIMAFVVFAVTGCFYFKGMNKNGHVCLLGCLWLCLLGSWISFFDFGGKNIVTCYYGEIQKQYSSKILRFSRNYYNQYNCFNNDTCFEIASKVDREQYVDSLNNCVLVSLNGLILKNGLDSADKQKYKYPVAFQRGYVETGNDSYEFARYSPNIEYDNYGFNLVYIAIRNNNNTFAGTSIKGTKIEIDAPQKNNDTILIYSNINPRFFDGWHICNDSISTTNNIFKIIKDGYGFIFRGTIYTKGETEKYWNIIEQCKLRNII